MRVAAIANTVDGRIIVLGAPINLLAGIKRNVAIVVVDRASGAPDSHSAGISYKTLTACDRAYLSPRTLLTAVLRRAASV